MAVNTYPNTFLDLNDIEQKELNIVVQVEGSPFTFSLVPTFKKIRYGEDGIRYGDPGLVYGGLIEIASNKAILSSNSNLVIQQKIEPEQGRASAALFSLEFVDLDGFMSAFVSPTGQYLDEILGGKQIKIYLGHKNSSFKEDYFCVFRGYVSQTTFAPSKIILQLTDANIKRKQQIFYTGKTKISVRNLNLSPSNIDIIDDKITFTQHGYVNNTKIAFFPDMGGVLPSPLIEGTEYFAKYIDDNTFKVTLEPDGMPINLTTAGSGTFEVDLLEIGDGTGLIYVDDLSNFVQPKLGPNGLYDQSLITYLKIEDELLLYEPTSILSPTLIRITGRGQLETLAVNHAVFTDIDNQFSLTGNVVDLSLKLMLSGNKTLSNIKILNFVNSRDPEIGLVNNIVAMPNGVDVVDDYGWAVGDYLTVTGSAFNNGTYLIAGFEDLAGLPNNGVYLNDTNGNPAVFTLETSTNGVFFARSQYDTLPDDICSGLRMSDVDVAGWLFVRDNFAFQSDCIFNILITQPESGKEFIEKEFLLPAGLYGITRYGRISASATKPPVAGEGLVTLDSSNVLDPQNITAIRSLNTRRFFNEVQYRFDLSTEGKPLSVVSLIDTDSLELFDTSSVLPITAKGLRTALGANTFIQRRGGFILRRYKNVAYEITLTTNFKAASVIEVSDAVALVDNGGLQIINFTTGARDIGAQLFEVIQRSLDLKTGRGTLTLLSQIGYELTDRFGGIAPSSLVQEGSTTTRLKIAASFAAKYKSREWRKWKDIIGDTLQVRTDDYSTVYITRFLGFDGGDPNILIIEPIPTVEPGMIIDIAPFDLTDTLTNQKSKLLYGYIDPTLFVTTGVDNFSFNVSVLDAAKIAIGQFISVHNSDYSIKSPESRVLSLVGTLVTVQKDLGFTPSMGDQIELVGFNDGPSGPYRIY